MDDPKDFESRFTKLFQPVFLWGVAAFEMTLAIYVVYKEMMTGSGPPLLSTVLPLSVAIAVAWAVMAVLITLAILGVRHRGNRRKD